METKLKVLIFLVFLNTVTAQQPIDEDDDECPEFHFNKNVSMTNEKLTGIWYLHANIPKFFELDMKCTFFNFTGLGEDHLQFVKYEFNNITNEPRETTGTVEYTREGSTTIFYTELLLPFEYLTIAINQDFWILVTCSECGFFSEEGAGLYAYVFTRLQYPPCEVNDEITKLLKNNHIQKNFVVIHEQNNCPFC